MINAWLIGEGGLDIHRGAVIGLCAESRAVEIPAPLRAARERLVVAG